MKPNRQTASEETFILEHTGVGFLYLVRSGDFVLSNFIPKQIKIVLQKVQFPQKFKIKSFDDPRKTFVNKKLLPVCMRARPPLIDYRHCTFIFSYIFIYIIYSFNSLPKQCA